MPLIRVLPDSISSRPPRVITSQRQFLSRKHLMNIPRTSVLLCLTASVAVLGCGDGRQKMGVAKVEGTVTCDGQPVANVAVYFVPKRSGDNALTGKGGIGYCDDKGHFVVTTYDSNDGAVVGKHDVCVGSPLGGYAKPGFKCDCALNSELPVTEVTVVS